MSFNSFSKQCRHRTLHNCRQSLVAEEVRRVQSGHRRVLGELNLSVEAMLMPTAIENNEKQGVEEAGNASAEELVPLVNPTDDFSRIGCDMDSGFSGSSSASVRYIEQLSIFFKQIVKLVFFNYSLFYKFVYCHILFIDQVWGP